MPRNQLTRRCRRTRLRRAADHQGAKVLNMSTDQNTTKDSWDKAKILSGFIASILIPAVLAMIGHWSSDALKSREVAVKYTELALDILSRPAQPGSQELRGWSTEVISLYSGVNMKEEVRDYLKVQDLGLKAFDELWVPEYTERVAKSVVLKEQWKSFMENPGTEEGQATEVKDLLEAYYKQIRLERERVTGSSAEQSR